MPNNIQMGRNLPKVTEYVKNLGKSVAYSTVDYFKSSMEDTSDFIESNQELFKDIYSAARNYRYTMKAVNRSIRISKVYEAGQALKKSLFESIRTGKFYDEKREQEYSERAAGDMADFGDMDDWGSANDFDINVSDESFDQSDAGKSSSIVSGAIHDATEAQAGIIAKSTEYLAETHKASTKLLFAQGERLYATVNGGLANTQALLSRVNGFLEGPLATHMENSTKFYQEITGKMNEVTAMMKESLEMQRNLYKKEQKSYEGSQYYKVGSNPDLKEYGQQVFKNFKEFLGPEVGMLLGDDMGEGSNMLMALVANPLRFIPDYLVRIMVPATIKKSLETLDKSFSGLFANMIARFNKWGSDTSDAPEILKAIGRIFGLRTDSKSTIDTSNYEKGAVPFDGVTKKAITQVIPGYLARIESALTTREERLFDYESGKWMNVSEVEKRYKSRKQRTISDAAYDTSDEIREYYAQLLKKSKAEAEKFQKNVQQVYKKIYEDYGAFEPYRAHGFGDEKQDPWDYYAGTTGMSKEEFLEIARMIVGTAGAIDPATGKRIKGTRKRNAMGLAAAMLDARESQARWYRDIEARGLSPIIQLAAGAYKNIDMNSDELSRTATGARANLSGINNMIVDATDKYNKNIFYYLRGMYAELMAIRQSGLGGGKGRGRRRGGPTGPVTDPRTALEKVLATEVDAEAARVAAQNISDQQSENSFNADNFAENWRLEAERRLKEKQDQDKKKGLFGHIMSDDDEEASDKGFLESLLQAGSLGAKFKVITQNINKLMAKPGLAIAGIIDTADRRLFQLVFGSKEGEEITDKEGRSVKGFLEYMVMRTRETFDNLNDWLDENILEPLKKKLGVNSLGEFFKKLGDRFGITDKWNSFRDKYVRPVGQRLREKFGWGWGQFKGAMGRTYGAALHRVLPPNAKVQAQQNPSDFLGMGPVDDGVDYDSLMEYMNPDLAASGGLVTRRGLAIISPGERIIPIGGRVTQRNNLAAEKAFAKRFGIRGANYFAGGNATTQPIPDLDRDKVVDTTKTVINEVMGDTKHKGIANVIASGLIGGGVSLVTGLVGGPLLGAAVGSAFGIAQNSQTVQEWLFGKEIVNQETGERERSGGVISKDFQEKFKKYFPGIRDFGIAGAVAGLFTPFGLVGGLVAGSAIGFAKQTDTFQEWLFGKADENGERDGGLLKKEFRDRVKKAAPRMAIGAVGGALLGPFGILGNAVLGSALGYVTTTDQFKNFVFGKPDENGKRKGGVVGAMYNGLLKPALVTGKKFIEDFTKLVNEKVFDPLSQFIKPFGQLIKNTIISIGDHFKDFLTNMAQNTIGQPITDFLEHKVFRGVATWTKRLLFLPVTAAKAAISLPFGALGAIGKNMRMGQIRRGTATDMTAAQRNEFRNQHPGRRLLIGRQDVFSKLDRDLEGLKGEAGVTRMKEMRDQLKIYLNTKDELGNQAAEMVKQAGQILSDWLNNTMSYDDPQKTLYQVNKYKDITKIHEAIAKGDIEAASRAIYKLNIDKSPNGQADQLIAEIRTITGKIAEMRQKIKNAGEYQKNLQFRLGLRTGGALRNTRNIRRFSRMLDTEIDAREAQIAEEKAKNPEQAAADTVNDTINKRTTEIVRVLKQINFGIKVLTGQDQWGSENDPFVQEAAQAQREQWSEDTNFDPEGFTPAPGDENFVGPMPLNEQQTEQFNRLQRLNRNPKKPGIISRARTAFTQTKERFTQNVKDKAFSMGGLIGGKAADITQAFNSGYHMVTTESGEMAAADSKGKFLPSAAANRVKKAIKQREEEKKAALSLSERVATTAGVISKGIFGTVGNLFTMGKESIGGLLSTITNNTGIMGKIFGALPKLGLLAIGIAAAGHFSELWKTTIWPNFVQPAFDWIKDKFGGFFTSIYNFLGDTFPNIFGENGLVTKLFNTIATGIDKLVNAPGEFFKGIVNWFGEGFKLFGENVLTPMLDFVIPRLSVALWKVLHSTSLNDLMTKIEDKSVSTVENQRTNEKGEALYYDEEGNITTEKYDEKTGKVREAVIDETSVTETVYDNSGLGWLRNRDASVGAARTRKREAKVNGYNFTCLEYDNDTIVIRSEDTGEYIRIDNGLDKAKKVTYGITTDESGQMSNGSILGPALIGGLIGKFIGATVGAGAAAAISSKIGAAVGSAILPGIGTIIGMTVGAIAGLGISYLAYKMSGGGYVREMDLDISSDDAGLLLLAFGIKDSNIDNWPSVGSIEDATVSSNSSERWEINSATSPGGIKDNRIVNNTNTSDLSKLNLPEEGSTISVWNSVERKTEGKFVNSNDGTMKYLRKYTTSSGKTAYYDIRKNYTSLPPEIQELVTSAEWKEWMRKASSMTDEDFELLSSFPSNTGASRKRHTRRRRKSALSRHLYQNSAELAGKKFGNTTLGDAGCGPVAAVNMIRRLSGKGPGEDIDAATKMALGYQDSTGGTTMDYFTDYFNTNGYSAAQTDSKRDIFNSLASGKPAVLLGNSGKETGTPFGANNHYINALGFDNTGKNIVVEDPDLPQSTVKYPAKDVLKDTISGVVTGRSRIGFGRKLSDYVKLRALNRRVGNRRSGKGNTLTIYKMTPRIAGILYSGESGGNYDAVNPNDNGAVSVGLIQWHGCRAWDVLNDTVNALGETKARELAGDKIYEMITTKTRNQWDNIAFTKGSTDVANIKKLLATQESQDAQKVRMLSEINQYINEIRGKGITDENAIAYLCHVKNAYGYIPQRFIDAAKATAGSVGAITLDDIYNACLSDSGYYSLYGGGYAQKIYNAILNTEKAGSGTETVDIGNVDLNISDTVSTVNAAASTTTATDSSDGSLVSILKNIGYEVMRRIYGDDILNLLGVGTNSSTSSTSSSGVYGTGTYSGEALRVPASASVATKQKALVDAMNSIKGKITYDLYGPQNPDQGSASCASTVGWAYKKVLGITGMSASSQTQSTDSRFQDVIRLGSPNTQPGKTFDLNLLQPGDIVYMYNKGNGWSSNHTEMYAGNGMDLSHGGPDAGPQDRVLDEARQKKVWAVRRLTDFVEQSKAENTANSAVNTSLDLLQNTLNAATGSGRSRRKARVGARKNAGHARIDTSTISKANTAIRKYGIDSNLVTSPPTDESSVYAQYFAAMVTLLSVIADNTEALSSLQTALAQRGATVPTETIQAAAGNARKRMSGKSRNKNIQPNTRMNGGYVDLGDSTDMQNILNSPTGDILRVMEALATE